MFHERQPTVMHNLLEHFTQAISREQYCVIARCGNSREERWPTYCRRGKIGRQGSGSLKGYELLLETVTARIVRVLGFFVTTIRRTRFGLR